MEAPPAFRCLDWNPDIRVAQKLGVEIRYSSLTNEVVCPQLNISSSRPGGLGDGPSFPAFSKAATELNAGQNSANPANTATTSKKVSSASTSSSGSNTESSSSRIKN
jgi:hypothetical protein